MADAKVVDRSKDSDIHEAWALKAVEAGVAKLFAKKANGDDVAVTINDVPSKGDKVLVPFNALTFQGITTVDEWTKLWDVAETFKGIRTNEDGDEEPSDNPLPGLLDYAYGLNRRSKIRVAFEKNFEDPEAADKKLLAMLIKQGRVGAIRDKGFDEQAPKVQARLRQMVELMKADDGEETEEE